MQTVLANFEAYVQNCTKPHNQNVTGMTEMDGGLA